MHSLTVLYDSHCGLCRRIKQWLATQPAYLNVEFMAAGSPEAVSRYPSLDHGRTIAELTVISDEGGVYEGADAFLMCLYALQDYRSLALTLATPVGRPLLRVGLWGLERLRGSTLCDGSCGIPGFTQQPVRPPRRNRQAPMPFFRPRTGAR